MHILLALVLVAAELARQAAEREREKQEASKHRRAREFFEAQAELEARLTRRTT